MGLLGPGIGLGRKCLGELSNIDCLEHKGDMSSFWSFGLFGFKSLLLAKPFMVHKNFQLFSAVLVANEHTHFGDMSSFVQDLTKSDCTKVTWHLCALQVFGFAKHKGDMSMVDT